MKSMEEDTKFKCSHCPKEFKYNSEKIRHETSHYQLFECDICAKKFNFQSALRRHQKQHERTGSAQCEKCDRKFRDEVLLKRHIEYAHKGTFFCTKCSSTYHSKLALSAHMRTHQPQSERQFRCSFCDKSFNFSHHLKHHEMTHTKVKQHYCSVCGKGFIQSHHLKSHMKTHNTSDRYFCEYPDCDKKFTSKYTMKRHMLSHGTQRDNRTSSDDSCDVREIKDDSTICSCCGEKIPNNDYDLHSKLCALENENLQNWSIQDNNQDDLIEETSPVVNSPKTVDIEIGDCKTVLGSCITDSNNCICEQLSKPHKDNDINNKELINHNNNIPIDDRDELVDIDLKNDKTLSSACEGCECANICTEKAKINCNMNKNKYEDNNNMPNITCGEDGVIKIDDTFDLDLKLKFEVGNDTFLPFNTCKDVIGKCLVGGNGAGCLCAKMVLDEEQSYAQEIEDITPHPKTDN